MPRLAPVIITTRRSFDRVVTVPPRRRLYGDDVNVANFEPKTSDELRFDDKVAIVTGAGRGLGREHALMLASRGARVVVNDVNAEHARITADDIVAKGGIAVADANTVATPEGTDGIVRTAIDSFGGLHVLLNNAGRFGPGGLIEDASLELMTTIVHTHMVGTYLMCRAAWPILKAQRYGRVLITASSAAIGNNGMAAYSMAKSGLLGLTRSLAIEGADHGIKVNALMPIGYTRSAALNPNPDTRAWMERNFPPHLCAAAAVVLLHDSAPASGDFFPTGAGRTALIGSITTPGWNGGPAAGPEDLRAHWDEVTDTDGAVWMRHSRDDLGFYTGDAAFPG
ncbi:MAG: SDR family NAD(P)-dependent oxidoreductase [Actinobacteria bacterium]|nr:SDR family NAD(P)-dependent oxidoreductase [Actinomycetota bacterium]